MSTGQLAHINHFFHFTIKVKMKIYIREKVHSRLLSSVYMVTLYPMSFHYNSISQGARVFVTSVKASEPLPGCWDAVGRCRVPAGGWPRVRSAVCDYDSPTAR